MNNQKLFTKFKTKLLCFVIALGLMISAFSGFSFGTKSIFAYDEDLTSSYINDATFTSYTGSKPYTPSNWSRIEGQGKYNSETMAGGIFNDYGNTISDEYRKAYKVLEKGRPGLPLTTEEIEKITSSSHYYYSLSLSAPYATGGNFGYKQSSSSLNLNKNSFYEITVVLKTVSGTFTTLDINDYGYVASDATPGVSQVPAVFDARASVYLTGFNDKDDASFEMVESSLGKPLSNGWGEYIFYIATNEFKGESSLGLELWLGSKTASTTGTVYFNQVSVRELDGNTFGTITSDADSSSFKKLVDLRDNSGNMGNIISNPTFNKNAISNWNWTDDWDVVNYDVDKAIIKVVDVNSFKNSDAYRDANLDTTDLCGTNLRSNDNYVLFMANTENCYTAIKTNADITISRQTYYKLSLWAWSGSNSEKAPTIKLTNSTDGKTIDDASITVATNCEVGSSATNGWVNYSFYIYGDAFEKVTCKIQICIGSESESATGYLYVDSINMSRISYSQYKDSSSESNSTTFVYNKSAGDYTVSNHDFNITENEKNSNKYPLAPASWTYSYTSTNQNTTTNGVVDPNHRDFMDSLKIADGSSSAYNPGARPDCDSDSINNILMLGSKENSTQTYTSSSFSLSKSDSTPCYKISFYINARNGGVNIVISNAHAQLVTLENIKTDGWAKITTLVKLENTESDYTIKFSLVNNTSTAKYAFFDYVLVDGITETVYDEMTASSVTPSVFGGEHIIKLDRSIYDFETSVINDISKNGFTESSKIDGAWAKVVPANDFAQSAHSGNNVLVVYSNSVNNGEYTVKTNRNFNASSSSYYKISMFVKTFDIKGNGAKIDIYGEGFATLFENIDTLEDGWTEYSFYINSKTTAEITLAFGFDDNACGYLMIDDIAIEKLAFDDEEAFNAEVDSLNSNTVKNLLIEAKSEDETTDEEETNEDETFSASFNWYIVTALVTAVAIIVAVVGVMLRKVDWKPSKKVKTTYDRAKTLDKDLDRRERIAKRQAQINALETQLREIEAEIEKIKQENAEFEAQRKAENDKIKAEILARKEAIKAEKENAMKERNAKLAKDKNAFTAEEEENFNAYIKQLEKSEKKEQLELAKHEKKASQVSNKTLARLEKYLARQEFIRAEIARIDAEIEEIAKEEAQIWEEYRLAKEDAKRRKAEYKASLKQQKEEEKLAKQKAKEESKKDDNKTE